MLFNLQALRAFAAYTVVLAHFVPLYRRITASLNDPPFGTSGVDLFFVISGFIMVHTTTIKPISAFTFFWRRVIRVAPLYWLATSALFVVALVLPQALGSTEANLLMLAKSLFFVPFAKSNGLIQPILFVGWTLNYEMFFYAIFAVSMLLPRASWRIASACVSISSFVIAGVIVHPTSIAGRFYTDPVMIDFVFGMLLAAGTRRYLLKNWSPIAFLGIAISAVGLMALAPYSGWLPRPIGIGLPAALAVFGALGLESHGNRVNSRLVGLAGDASYATYLTHFFVAEVVIIFAQRINATGATAVLLLSVGFLIVTFVGIGVHLMIEQPITIALRGRTNTAGGDVADP